MSNIISDAARAVWNILPNFPLWANESSQEISQEGSQITIREKTPLTPYQILYNTLLQEMQSTPRFQAALNKTYDVTPYNSNDFLSNEDSPLLSSLEKTSEIAQSLSP